MMIDRRRFLAGTAALPWVFGLRELLAQETPEGLGWLRSATTQMKEQRRNGLVLVVGAAGPARQQAARSLQEILESMDVDVRELLRSVVLICMTPETATGSVRSAGETVTRILLDPDGRRLAADDCHVPIPTVPKLFAALNRPFVFGEKGERLKQQSEALEAGLSPKLRQAFADLDAEDPETRAEASKMLIADAERVLPRIVWLRQQGPTPEIRVRCQGILEAHFEKVCRGIRLPYGCDQTVPETLSPSRPCLACGMAVRRVEADALIRFLTK